MILVIDNYDSFVYNIVQYVGYYYQSLKIFRNDKINIENIKKLNPNGIILSPGPGRPENSGICLDIMKNLYNRIPILGICLGHQIIGQHFGAQIINANQIIHGKTSNIFHEQSQIFYNINSPFKATRYHSLIIDNTTMPDSLKSIAKTKDNIIMAVEHIKYPIVGLQFHPESILTEKGKQIIKNFLIYYAKIKI